MNYAIFCVRGVVLILGTICGFYTGVAAFRVGQLLGTTWFDSLVFGSAFTAVVVAVWFLPVLSRFARLHGNKGFSRTVQGVWCLLFVFVLVNAIGYTAYHRDESVGERLGKIEQYDRAKQTLSMTVSNIEEMKKHKRWNSTKGCTNATVPKSIKFCETYEEEKAVLQEARETLNGERPASGDPQADRLAFASKIAYEVEPELIGKAMPIYRALILELAAIICFYAALAPIVKSPSKSERSPTKNEAPVKKKPGRPKGSKDKQPRQRRRDKLPTSRISSLPPELASAFKLDGRTARGYRNRIANDSNESST